MQIMIEINDIPKNDHERWVMSHGTPLPKGHGRLADIDAMIINRTESGSTVGIVCAAPIILEADKESTE